MASIFAKYNIFFVKHILFKRTSLIRHELMNTNHNRLFSNTNIVNNKHTTDNKIVVRNTFENAEKKNKQTFKEMVKIFETRDIHRRGHVEFIYAALKHMEEFGVHKDLEVYKTLIDVLPKGKFIPQNIFQSEFMHYPKQQQCIIDVLEKMEDNGVVPDVEMQDILINIFGRKGHPVRKYWRMMYWMPKFKNLSPWPVPNPPPNDSLELAKLAIQRITSVDLQTKVDIYQTSEIESSLHDTWVVSGQSPDQKALLAKHDIKKPLYVEGAYKVWLRDKPVDYFVLRAEPKPNSKTIKIDPDDVSSIHIPYLMSSPNDLVTTEPTKSVHEQDDGIIIGVCATGNSSRDSLLSWIRLLERHGNPNIENIPVIFTLKAPTSEIVVMENQNQAHSQKIEA